MAGVALTSVSNTRAASSDVARVKAVSNMRVVSCPRSAPAALGDMVSSL